MATVFSFLSAVAASVRPRVCIVGAGAGGLVAARLLREVADVVVFEKAQTVGGIWRPGAPVLYEGLVTNLPKQIMAYRDTPFPAEWNSFVTAAQVGEYLRRYCDTHDLWDCVRLGTPVHNIRLLGDGAAAAEAGATVDAASAAGAQAEGDAPTADQGGVRARWEVRYGADAATGDSVEAAGKSEIFDAVVVANGHYELPAYAELPGAHDFPGRILHSAEYDVPQPFAGQTVLCIGARSSGTDLAREISAHAERTLTADKACTAREASACNPSLFKTPPVARLMPDGSVRFADGSVEKKVDAIIHCVGYDYSFPFLRDETQSGVRIEVGDRRVSPLYEHMLHAEHPSLSFLGIPHSVVPFPLMEVQSMLLAKLLSGGASLPTRTERLSAVAAHEASLKRPKDLHHLGGAQWDYCRRLLEMAEVRDDSWARHIDTNEAVYNNVGPRRPPFPGGPDHYRSLEYHVDHATGEWSCMGPRAQ